VELVSGVDSLDDDFHVLAKDVRHQAFVYNRQLTALVINHESHARGSDVSLHGSGRDVSRDSYSLPLERLGPGLQLTHGQIIYRGFFDTGKDKIAKRQENQQDADNESILPD
jgi:hypothetical protein